VVTPVGMRPTSSAGHRRESEPLPRDESYEPLHINERTANPHPCHAGDRRGSDASESFQIHIEVCASRRTRYAATRINPHLVTVEPF